MKENVKDRILQWIEYNNLSVAAFERKCGLSTGYVANMKPNVNTKKFNEISIAFPELNIEWLKTGEGEMINPKTQSVINGDGNVLQDGRGGHHFTQTNNSEKILTEFIEGLKAQGVLTERSMSQTDKALEEISEQRKLMDRLITIIEDSHLKK